MSQPLQAAILAAARPLAVAHAGRAQLAAALEQFDEADWNTLIERALAHGTTSLLCYNLLALDVELLPPSSSPPARLILLHARRLLSER